MSWVLVQQSYDFQWSQTESLKNSPHLCRNLPFHSSDLILYYLPSLSPLQTPSATLNTLRFTEHSRYVSASKPLPWLFTLAKILLPQVSTWLPVEPLSRFFSDAAFSERVSTQVSF